MNLPIRDMQRIQRSVIRSENTPQPLASGGLQRRNIHVSGNEWAYNTTGYELQPGYIVAVTDWDYTTNRHIIARPTADDMTNIAVVKTYCENSATARVELDFSGSVLLWYTGTAPTVADTLGSTANSFLAKIGGSTFAPLETGSTISGYGRCRARFFSGAKALSEVLLPVNTYLYDEVKTTFDIDLSASYQFEYTASISKKAYAIFNNCEFTFSANIENSSIVTIGSHLVSFYNASSQKLASGYIKNICKGASSLVGSGIYSYARSSFSDFCLAGISRSSSFSDYIVTKIRIVTDYNYSVGGIPEEETSSFVFKLGSSIIFV